MNNALSKLIIITFFSFSSIITFSQGVAIKNTNTAPNSHSILDIDDSNNNKGILIPRVSTAERTDNSIGHFNLGSSEEGLTVYDTDTKSYWLWDGTAWVDFSSGGNGWSLSGNSIVSGDFIGTTNNEDFIVKTNNTEHWKFKTNGVISVSNTNQCVTIGGGTTIGYRNAYFGDMAGLYGQSGAQYNTALGYWSLGYNLAGDKNTAVGARALNKLYSGSNENTGVGYDCLHELSNGADYNTAIGSNAGYNLGMTDYCTMIGAYTDGSTNQNNQNTFGYGVTVSVANIVEIGNSSVTQIGGPQPWTNTSDGRVKRNVKEDVAGLNFIMKLRPVTYNLDIHKRDRIKGVTAKSDYPQKYDVEKVTYTGFIAQEVEHAARDCNYNFSGVKIPQNSKDLYGLTYSAFVMPLVKATQEQQKTIEQLQNTVSELKKEVEILKNK